MFCPPNKVKPCSTWLVLGWVTFSKAILRTAELPSLCNNVSSIYQLSPWLYLCVLFPTNFHGHLISSLEHEYFASMNFRKNNI